jgi:RNA polymerase sigma-70 factor (ECF subfamily)
LPATLDEVELVERTLRGEREAFRVIVLRHQGRLAELIFRQTGDRSGVEDLVQETFLRAFRSLDRFDPKYRLSTWLTRIALNAARDQGRRQKVRDETTDRFGDRIGSTPKTEPGPQESAVRKESAETVARALDALPFAQRQAVLLAVYGGLTQREIADTLDAPLGTVKSRLRAGFARLRDLVAPLHRGGSL